MRTSTTGNWNKGPFVRSDLLYRSSVLNNRAFTLLELIVVMALIALIASFSVPQIAGFLYADQLKVSVRKLVGLIHQSSQLAQRYQAPYLLTYQPKERTFIVGPERNQKQEQTETQENRLQLADSVSVRDLWSWYGGTRTSGELVIRFNKNGYVEPAIIHLRKDDDGQEISVVLSPFLGKVNIVDGYVLPEKEALFQ
jgi:prepilin-type N-terminal cleavage/methylation domain-containing protein